MGPAATSAPSCGTSTTPRVHQGEHVRVFPISNWTELDVWQYIAREQLAAAVDLLRAPARRWCAATACSCRSPPITPARRRAVEELSVRFRTVGDISCTCPVESTAATPEEIIAETAVTTHHRARRDAHGRPDVGRVHGAAQEGRIFLMSLLGEIERNAALPTCGVLRFITAGSVDDGKSTLIGRLLHDTRADPARTSSPRSSAPRASAARTTLDLSLLTDGLEAEREQGITIDVAYRYFATRAAQVHHRRHAGPRAVHAQHGDRRAHRRRRGDPARRDARACCAQSRRHLLHRAPARHPRA